MSMVCLCDIIKFGNGKSNIRDILVQVSEFFSDTLDTLKDTYTARARLLRSIDGS